MKATLCLLVFLALSSIAQAAGVEVTDRGNFVRIEVDRSGSKELVYINKSAILSASLSRVERTYQVQVITRELISAGNAAVNKTYVFSLFSAADAERTIEQIISCSNNN